MSQGTLFTTQLVRGLTPRALIKYFKLDVEIKDNEAAEFKDNFPLKKVPAFIGPKGLKLHETIAITYYCTYPLLTHSLQTT